jgi:hypothetical protein
VNSHAYLQDTIIIEKRRIDSRIDQVKAQVQDRHLEDIILLKLAIYIVTMDM